MLPALRARLVPLDAAVRLYGSATAAVAVILRERDGLEVLLTERTKRESDPWSGQWSFPGGGRQPGESLLETARRETEEEVGLSLAASEVLGCLEARSPGNIDVLVLPLVFRWDGTEAPRTGPEVASVAWVPVAELPKTRARPTIRIRDRELRDWPAFVQGSRTIWGFTYRLLEDLLALLPQ